MGDEQLIGLAGTIGVFAFLMVTAISAAWTVRHVVRLRAETLKLAIERGHQLPTEPPVDAALRDARRGVLSIALGLGLSIALGVLGGLEIAALGAIPTMLGVGWLVSARLARSKNDRLPPTAPSSGEMSNPTQTAPRHAVI